MAINNLGILFKEELNAQVQSQLYRLITIEVGGTVGTLNLAEANEDITFAGTLYYGFPCKVSDATITTTGEVATASITVANPERIFQSYLEDTGGLRKKKVSIKQVYARFIDSSPEHDPSAYIENNYYIESYVSTAESIVFSLCATVDASIKLPRGRFSPISCRHDYKDPETCGYVGGLAVCKKDLTDCHVHGRALYFGGFPGVPYTIRRLTL